MVPVYEWVDGGNVVGCGTQLELDHWKAQGVTDASVTVGAVIAHEPPSVDAARKAAWAL
jgi:hypothetical protein